MEDSHSSASSPKKRDLQQSYLHKIPFSKSWVKWVGLALACSLLIGDAYAFDNPMALQSTIQEEMGLSNLQFNMLYSIYSFPNIILPFFGGMLIDKMGVRFSILVFSTIITLGQSIVVIGGYSYSFATMLAGRCVFGIGSESLNAAQAAIMSHWFHNDAMSLALGLCLAIPKLGSAMNSFVSPVIQAKYGSLGFTLLVSLFIVIFSWFCGLVLVFLDKENEKRLDASRLLNKSSPLRIKGSAEMSLQTTKKPQNISKTPNANQKYELQLEKIESKSQGRSSGKKSEDDSTFSDIDFDTEEKDDKQFEDEDEGGQEEGEVKEEIKLSDLKHLDGTYWILACIIMFSEALFVPFLDNGNDFIQVKYGFTQESAGMLLTIPYAFSAAVTPFIGIYSDKIRQRSLLIVLTSVVFIITHLQLLLMYCDSACGYTAFPLFSLGLCFSLYSAILMPSIPMVVNRKMIGTAFGLVGVLQNTALALFPLITGAIYASHLYNNEGEEDPFRGYLYQSFFFVGISCLNFLISICLYLFDKRGSKKLSRFYGNKQ